MKLSHLAAAALLCAASAPLFAQTETLNSCQASVTGPRQGRHSADATADAVLWPPNHKYRTVSISASNSNGNACDVTINDVTQDEPVTGLGSGNTTPDAANCSNAGNTSSVDLRGERAGTNGDQESGMGTGRYYHVEYTMHDPDTMQDKKGTALILVPHDQGVAHLGTWVDEGPLFGSDGTTDMAISCSN